MNIQAVPKYYTWTDDVKLADQQTPTTQKSTSIFAWVPWPSSSKEKTKMIMTFRLEAGGGNDQEGQNRTYHILFDYEPIYMNRMNVLLNLQPNQTSAYKMMLTIKELTSNDTTKAIQLLAALTPYSLTGGVDRMNRVINLALKLEDLALSRDKPYLPYIDPLYKFTDYQLTHLMDVYKSIRTKMSDLMYIQEDLNEIHRHQLAKDHLPERTILVNRFVKPEYKAWSLAFYETHTAWFILSETTKYEDLSFLSDNLTPFLSADQSPSDRESCFVLLSHAITKREPLADLFQKAHQAKDADPFNFKLASFLKEATAAAPQLPPFSE